MDHSLLVPLGIDRLRVKVNGEYSSKTMMVFLRTLPNTLWWITLFLAVVAFFTQIGIAVARSGAVSVELLLAEFVFTLIFLAIPIGIAWYGRQRGSIWYAGGGLILLIAMARIFFF